MGIDIETGKRKAIKIIPLTDITNLSRVDTEIKVRSCSFLSTTVVRLIADSHSSRLCVSLSLSQAMLMLRHPNVVQLEEVFQDEGNVYFVMELCGGGSIADYVDVKPLSESLARYYFLQLVAAVKYCHSQVSIAAAHRRARCHVVFRLHHYSRSSSYADDRLPSLATLQGVVHRDLKLENMLLNNEGVLKVADFGHAGIFNEGWDLFSTAVGTLHHLAPEQVEGHVYSGEKVDLWALGIALYVE